MGPASVIVVGGGPAGMFLGLMLARAGVPVTVLEKHADFLRDFRGDTVHPPTLRLLDDLGLGSAFARLPAGRMTAMVMRIGSHEVTMGNLAAMPGRYRYFAMVPQWDLLDLLASAGRAEPLFTLRLSSQVTGLLRTEDGTVSGVRVRDAAGEHELRADLVVGCDGRDSVVRREAGLELVESRLPFDVWWVRVPMAAGDDSSVVAARFVDGQAAVSMARHDYHQVAYLIVKGTDAARRGEGLDRFRGELGRLFGWRAEQLAAIASWDDVKFLDARAGMLRRWHAPGLLCLGDAAHPMSPVMGVGINLAVQDAVAAARILGPHLRAGAVRDRHLATVERRRRVPTALTRAMQDNEHRHLVTPALAGRIGSRPLPAFVRVMQVSPRLSGLITWLQAVVIGRERTPAAARRPDPAANHGMAGPARWAEARAEPPYCRRGADQ